MYVFKNSDSFFDELKALKSSTFEKIKSCTTKVLPKSFFDKVLREAASNASIKSCF